MVCAKSELVSCMELGFEHSIANFKVIISMAQGGIGAEELIVG